MFFCFICVHSTSLIGLTDFGLRGVGLSLNFNFCFLKISKSAMLIDQCNPMNTDNSIPVTLTTHVIRVIVTERVEKEGERERVEW